MKLTRLLDSEILDATTHVFTNLDIRKVMEANHRLDSPVLTKRQILKLAAGSTKIELKRAGWRLLVMWESRESRRRRDREQAARRQKASMMHINAMQDQLDAIKVRLEALEGI